MPRDVRDAVVDFVRAFHTRTELSVSWILRRLGVARMQCDRWTERYGRVNAHNGQIPRDHWLTPAEEAILAYDERHPLDGYRRLTFMMLDFDVVAVSPSTCIAC